MNYKNIILISILSYTLSYRMKLNSGMDSRFPETTEKSPETIEEVYRISVLLQKKRLLLYLEDKSISQFDKLNAINKSPFFYKSFTPELTKGLDVDFL